mmetsp:Transcript_19870/g.52045  ORF Transcript_19870/g.52045 Transcript_19870/m.52045 type:complete len:90 (-) Transcript_19870:84-353(-)
MSSSTRMCTACQPGPDLDPDVGPNPDPDAEPGPLSVPLISRLIDSAIRENRCEGRKAANVSWIRRAMASESGTIAFNGHPMLIVRLLLV